MDKIETLLGRGYFPSQLPPAFTTSSFAQRHRQIAADWPNRLSRIPSTRGDSFSVARAGHSRRNVTIPNPVVQYFLCKEVAERWDELQKHFGASPISLSKPNLSEDKDRATEIAPLSELHEQRLIISAGYRYILKTDISRFFPTIYTHSIPWALHGKVNAKANTRNYDDEYFGNRIDYIIQRCQERQTLGIPIGPDTSHIISEVIATSTDVVFKDSYGRWPKGYRHVDDYFLCFNESREAETALSCLISALKEYELDINPNKTVIAKVEISPKIDGLTSFVHMKFQLILRDKEVIYTISGF